jgi:hypothetical protein
VEFLLESLASARTRSDTERQVWDPNGGQRISSGFQRWNTCICIRVGANEGIGSGAEAVLQLVAHCLQTGSGVEAH